jgi:GT2 family glycosyltransferase
VQAARQPTLSVVIVTWNEGDRIRRCLAALVPQLRPGDELIVSDSGSEDGTPELVRELAPGAIVIENRRNVGFAAGCNSGAERASGELLVLLNPDTEVLTGWREGIERPLVDRVGWDAWQALVTMDGGTRINTSGGVVHFTGLSWAGQIGQPVEAAPPERREVDFPSGACMAMPLAVWRRLNGMAAHFFLYCEDVEIGLRLRLGGGRIGIEPTARVDHDYSFSGRGVKWRMLERNRWFTVLRTYPPALLWLTLPALIATDMALLVVAATSGWGGQKALAIGDVLRALPQLVRERREVQAGRTAPAAAVAAHMTADLSSPYLGRPGESRIVRALLRAYWGAVRRILR